MLFNYTTPDTQTHHPAMRSSQSRSLRRSNFLCVFYVWYGGANQAKKMYRFITDLCLNQSCFKVEKSVFKASVTLKTIDLV